MNASTAEKMNDGGAAFAAMGVGPAGDIYHEHGMSIRDYIAIHADTSSFNFGDAQNAARAVGISDAPPENATPAELVLFSARVNAALRYILADVMLAERAKATGSAS